MNLTPVTGHQQILDRFQRWITAGRLASTWLLAGPKGIGKYRTARYIAQCLLCEGMPAEELTACGTCPACQQVEADTHPDLLEVARPANKNMIPVELLIGSRDQRMREGLCHDLSLKPFRGGYRIAIIDDADFLNQEGANCLLKTLEEPPPHALIFLITSSEHRQLPTIRSRSQIVRFQPLQPDDVASILRNHDGAAEFGDLDQLSLAAGGSIHMALQLAGEGVLEFRRDWFGQLATLDPTENDFAETLSAFVDEAGKDASLRRDRLRMLADLTADWFRHVLLSLGGQEPAGDGIQRQTAGEAVGRWRGDIDTAASCIERTGEVHRAIAANANQSVLIECWLSDLGRLMRGEPVAA